MPATATKAKTKRAEKAQRSAPKASAPARRGTGTAFPDWADLPATQPSRIAGTAKRAGAGAKKASKEAARKVRRARPLDAVPSRRFGALALAGCLVLTLFLGHAYATRATLDHLQDARRANEQLRLTNQRLRGEVDRMTGPSAVLGRAASLGLEEGVAYGPTIRLAD